MRFFSLFVFLIITFSLFPSCGTTDTPDPEQMDLAEISDTEMAGYLHTIAERDSISPYLSDAESYRETLKFFSSLVGSGKVAAAILEHADKNRVKPSLAFALALEESRFKPRAVNYNTDSIDRGLFQLNSKSFPHLSEAEVFDPETNARYGLAHLRFCLDQGGNEVAALAMYNAGNGRVDRGATPRRTLDYVYRVLAYEKNIARLFEAKVASRVKKPLAVLTLGEAKARSTAD